MKNESARAADTEYLTKQPPQISAKYTDTELIMWSALRGGADIGQGIKTERRLEMLKIKSDIQLTEYAEKLGVEL